MESSLPVLFKVLNAAVLPLWFGLLVFPRKKWPARAIDLFAVAAAIGYLIDIIPGISQIFPMLMKPELDSMGPLFSTSRGVYAAWSHFLIGDLWMGRWIITDSQTRKIRHVWIIPSLILTFLFGPAGLLSYLALRQLRRR